MQGTIATLFKAHKFMYKKTIKDDMVCRGLSSSPTAQRDKMAVKQQMFLLYSKKPQTN